jgi:DNA-binding Xre family transcriptional regulator
MSGKMLAYSRLLQILNRHDVTVADLIKKLSARGVSFDKKTLYRLAGPEPMQTINAPVLGALCKELNVGVGELITWEPPKPELRRIDEKTQERLSRLMEKNNEGKLTSEEAKELAELGGYAEKLSLENARVLARFAKAERGRNAKGRMVRTAVRKKIAAAAKARP